jgi:hypothetical protein
VAKSKIKRYSGEDEESLVQPFAGKMRMGANEGSSAGLRADKDGFSLQTMLGKMEKEDIGGPKTENYSPAQIRAAYRKQFGEGSVSAGVSRSAADPHTQIRDLSGDIPVGNGRLFGGLNEVLSHGEKVGRGKNIGYSGEVGPGRLSASIAKNGDRKMGNLTYQMPFKKGGKVTASSRADGIAARGKTKGRVI